METEQPLRRTGTRVWRYAALLAVGVVIIAGGIILFLAINWDTYSNPIDDFHFAPGKTTWNELPPKPPDAIRFAVIGDFGIGNANEQFVADMIHSWSPDFIVSTGDNNYPSGRASTIDKAVGKYYHDFIFPYNGSYGSGATENRFFPVLGNHDWRTTNAQPFLDYFTLPGNERYYDFAWGPVHFFAVDSSSHEPDGWTLDSVQAQWLKEGLAASDSAWNLVYMHRPPYSSSKHGSQEESQWPYKEWGADAVFSAHDHVYERVMRDDFPYFVVGLGGDKIYPFKRTIEGSVVRYRKMHGAMLVDVTPDEITFRFYSIDNGGTLIDSYTIRQAPEELPM
jgi:hypothetical protein